MIDKMSTKAMVKEPVKFSHYAGAMGVFLRTSTSGIVRSVPERPKELGGRRGIFDLNIFVFESLRTVLDMDGYSPNSYIAMETFSKYITRIDDIMDSVKHPRMSEWNSSYKKDPNAKQIISMFVKHIKSMEKGAIINKNQATELFNAVHSYRKRARIAIERFENLNNPDITDILLIKRITTGGMGAIMADIVCICESVPESKRNIITGAFSDAFMATQIADDINDLNDDIKNNVPNIAAAIIQQIHIDESSVLEMEKMDIKTFRRRAPKSYNDLMRLGGEYISLIPKEPFGLGVLRAIPVVFYNIISLTSRSD